MEYFALAYYIFEHIEEPKREVKNHKRFFKDLDVQGRIYISKEGINGQMSGSAEACDKYMEWLKSDPRFSRVHFKLHPLKENIFPRMTVKYREHLVALGEEADVKDGGEHVCPQEWKKMLESGEYLILDVRNNYESKIGHFEGATLPDLETFRDFPAYADKLATEKEPENTKVMMYCTGGIRCEVYSALLKKRGFKDVYQLDGGVINYGLKEGKEHWKGSLFVFDDRLATSIDGEKAEPISNCSFCNEPSDTYYNCANMDCNELFLACPKCIEKQEGACSEACQYAPRKRPFDLSKGNRPFRKKHLLECGCLTD
ncbi:MAG: rhodanese-related sulfurtransferase [Chlamydiales bacterium]|nr:rhodanese-related sulfurtransferase [Chlamydiales bacterium]